MLIVYVRMLDKQGVLCPVNGIPVELSVQGGENRRSYFVSTGSRSRFILVRTGEISKININATGKGFSTRKSLKGREGINMSLMKVIATYAMLYMCVFAQAKEVKSLQSPRQWHVSIRWK